jgi:hypothetical protein
MLTVRKESDMTMPQDREAVAAEVAEQRKLDEAAVAEAEKPTAPVAPPASAE